MRVTALRYCVKRCHLNQVFICRDYGRDRLRYYPEELDSWRLSDNACKLILSPSDCICGK